MFQCQVSGVTGLFSLLVAVPQELSHSLENSVLECGMNSAFLIFILVAVPQAVTIPLKIEHVQGR